MIELLSVIVVFDGDVAALSACCIADYAGNVWG